MKEGWQLESAGPFSLHTILVCLGRLDRVEWLPAMIIAATKPDTHAAPPLAGAL
jgi:hypothetical protein